MVELEALAAAGEDVALVLAAQWLERDERERAAEQGARPPRARPAWAADRVGQLGRRPDRRGDLRGDGAAADRVLRDPAVAIARRAVPPVRLDLPARVGPRAAGLAAHRPHRRRVVDRQGPRAERGPRALRGAARVPARRLARRPRAGRGSRATGSGLPLVVFPNGTVLADPTNLELASAAGATIDPERRDFDVVIVGGGPAGLSAAVYGASEGFRTLVVDDGGIGGQATSSSLIRNYLGFPRGVSGRRLAESAYEQAWVFGAKFAFMHDATAIRRDGDRLHVSLSDGGEVSARAVILATGATYRRLEVAELEELVGAGVFYGGPASEAPTTAGEEVHVVGGANSAGQAALHLAEYARRVTLVVRGGCARRRGCRTTSFNRSRTRPTSRCASGPRSSAAAPAKTAGWSAWSCAPRRRRDRDRRIGRALPDDRRPPEHGLAAGRARAGGRRVHSHRRRSGERRELAARAQPVLPRDQHARRLRRGRRPSRVDEPRRLRGRRGLDRDQPRPRALRGRPTPPRDRAREPGRGSRFSGFNTRKGEQSHASSRETRGSAVV